MEIVDIRAIPLERKLEQAFQGGTYVIDSRYTLVTEVHLKSGVFGQTFGGDEEVYQKEIARIINGPFRKLLVGRNVFEIEKNWEAMFCSTNLGLANRGIHTLDLRNKSILMQAIAAVDIASWDAIGKQFGIPLFQLLGGYRERVPVIAIGGYYMPDKGSCELEKELLGYKLSKLSGLKLKVGRLSPVEDAERVRFVRHVVGDDFLIACDANQAWTVDEALQFCHEVRGLNVHWFEEPIAWYDQLGGLPEVRRRGGLPVVAGQGEISRFGCRDLIDAGAVDILNVDATIAGGVTEWRRIASLASCYGIRMAHHEEPQISIHLLASIPQGLYVEIFPDPARDPLWLELPTVPPQINDGYMETPHSPGVGITLNQAVITRYSAAAGAVGGC